MCIECETAPATAQRLIRQGHIEVTGPSILECGAAGAFYGFAAFAALAACWAIGTGVNWVASNVPGIIRFSLAAFLVGGFSAGVWAKVRR